MLAVNKIESIKTWIGFPEILTLKSSWEGSSTVKLARNEREMKRFVRS
jgi:hypothetical protein